MGPDEIEEAIGALRVVMMAALESSRERALALTKLDEMEMWAARCSRVTPAMRATLADLAGKG